MGTNKSLIQRLLDAGYPREQIYHHESDLYVFVTPLTMRIVEGWCKDNGYRRWLTCPIFKDHITGKAMYDCAFQYDDYLEEVNKRGLHQKDLRQI